MNNYTTRELFWNKQFYWRSLKKRKKKNPVIQFKYIDLQK